MIWAADGRVVDLLDDRVREVGTGDVGAASASNSATSPPTR
jgi:hypothetical protein